MEKAIKMFMEKMNEGFEETQFKISKEVKDFANKKKKEYVIFKQKNVGPEIKITFTEHNIHENYLIISFYTDDKIYWSSKKEVIKKMIRKTFEESLQDYILEFKHGFLTKQVMYSGEKSKKLIELYKMIKRSTKMTYSGEYKKVKFKNQLKSFDIIFNKLHKINFSYRDKTLYTIEDEKQLKELEMAIDLDVVKSNAVKEQILVIMKNENDKGQYLNKGKDKIRNKKDFQEIDIQINKNIKGQKEVYRLVIGGVNEDFEKFEDLEKELVEEAKKLSHTNNNKENILIGNK